MKDHLSSVPTQLPRRDRVADCLEWLLFLLFPNHLRPRSFSSASSDVGEEKSAEEVRVLVEKELVRQLSRSLASHPASTRSLPGEPSTSQSPENLVSDFLQTLPSIREKLLMDARAARDRDPAVESLDEVIFCYPGFFALATYRIAHELALRKVPFIPRMMSETAHAMTGCDIHPEAQIGEALFIDHATGVVIGQTAVVGDRVTIFQGVTLGAVALQEKGSTKKRHPTIEDDVILYAHATILGGDTVIGKRSVIGGSCWITFSVPPDSKIILANPRSLLHHSQKEKEYVPNWDI